jgi:hypothetical protein
MGLLQALGWHEDSYSALGPYGFTVRRVSYIPVSAELTEPAVFIPIGFGFLAVGLIASYFVFVSALSRTVEVRRTSSVPFVPLGVLLIFSGLSIRVFVDPEGGLIQTFLWQTAFGLGILCFYLQRQARASSAKDVMAHDSRPPVLYLRAFEAERGFVKTKSPWFGFGWANQAVTFDRFLESAVSKKNWPIDRPRTS